MPHEAENLIFSLDDVDQVIGHVRKFREGDPRGWLNVKPEVSEDDMPPPPGFFRFFSQFGPQIPVVTWVPGKPGESGKAMLDTIGILHCLGPKLSGLLEEMGLTPEFKWKVIQDHSRRGLVAYLEPESDLDLVVRWMTKAATTLVRVPTTGKLIAELHKARRT